MQRVQGLLDSGHTLRAAIVDCFSHFLGSSRCIEEEEREYRGAGSVWYAVAVCIVMLLELG
ncbi:hypothetical protein KY285_023953 [Solanum tuberosum]|nr:hypothetical protein KY289_024300 [Solanum tuberosum]KAH0676152.1 hypothetical protein KY285_023953 [Solanum tuberosum]